MQAKASEMMDRCQCSGRCGDAPPWDDGGSRGMETRAASGDFRLAAVSVEPCCTPMFPTLPTELLILILSYLPVVELCAVQRTCHRIHNIVAESAQLQYVLRTQINGVDDLLPPDCPFSERLELLRRHENAWSNLQLKLSHEFASPLLDRHFLQDGYLIYNKIAGVLQYGYVDLLSAVPDEELCWVHISREDIRHPLCVIFAVDHNLAVVLRYLSFFPPSYRM
jgi:hypothetical protein